MYRKKSMDTAATECPPATDIDTVISEHAQELSEKLQAHRLELFPPAAEKTLRAFQVSEAARILGLKKIVDISETCRWKGKGRSRWSHRAAEGRTAEQLQELRRYLDETGRPSKRYLPSRRNKEQLQVIAIVNFKGGSGKTTTAAHLAQHLALAGHRVLAIDLDPQASLSALHGFRPEFDVGANETLYAAIRYNQERRPLREIIKKTNFPGLHIVPGNIELMEFKESDRRAYWRCRMTRRVDERSSRALINQ